jgi:hypothetical protein
MKRIYIPTSGVDEWRKLLADPEKHWRTGFSARSLAYAWENAKGFPPEIQDLFTTSDPPFQDMELLLAIPEHKVQLAPNTGHPSQNDLFVLARNSSNSLVAITLEGKVSESFDQSLSKWNKEGSRSKAERLTFIKNKLGLANEALPEIRYQLLHRTASAMIEAERFTATSAMMIVHSFSQSDSWFEDYQAFVHLYGIDNAVIGKLYHLGEISGINLFSGWVRGDEKFLKM